MEEGDDPEFWGPSGKKLAPSDDHVLSFSPF